MFVIYGKQDCPQCDLAKNLCKQKDVDFEYKQLDTDYTLDELIELSPQPVRSVPVIFYDSEYIGSTKNLIEKLKEI